MFKLLCRSLAVRDYIIAYGFAVAIASLATIFYNFGCSEVKKHGMLCCVVW
jgi:hypothetical protein